MEDESASEDTKPIEVIQHEGKPYRLLQSAADQAQVPVGTLVRWAETGVTNFGLSLGLVRDPATQAAYISEESIAALASRFQPIAVAEISTPKPPPPQPLEWKEGRNGHVEYGGKTYLPQKRATKGLGLHGKGLWDILHKAKTPQGELVDVIHDRDTRTIYLSQALVEQLHTRFVYADTSERLGFCTVHSGKWNGLSRYGSYDNHLRAVEHVYQDIQRSEDACSSPRVEKLQAAFEECLKQGKTPSGTAVRKIRDTVTNDELITFRAAQAVYMHCRSRLK